LRIAAEQPQFAHRRPPAMADPVAQRVARERARRRAQQRVRTIQVAEPDQGAHGEQPWQRRHHDAHHRQRVAARGQEDQQDGRLRMRADPGNGVVEPCAMHRRSIKAADYTQGPSTAARSMSTLSGKTLFITGASRGIGLAIALRAARDGANVAIAAKSSVPNPKLPGTIHSAAEAVNAAGGRGLALKCDIREEDQVRAAVAATVEAFGGIDILVNNASAIWLRGTLDTPIKRFDLMHQVNARG